MTTHDPLAGFLATLDVGALLQSKALTPLSDGDKDRLAEIEALDITGWTETEIRADVIDPVVRILGYRKGDLFSVDREKAIAFRDSKRFIDYAVTIWSQNFWLIEAKRPASRPGGFSQKDIDQALGYATHPDINAAIVVLTDGDLWEIFDRETDIANPLLRFRRVSLRENFDNLRRVVGPWQAWFLEKRRILRLVDRVFDSEVNLGRVDEFRGLIDRQLLNKRGQVLDNFRALNSSQKSLSERRAYLQQSDAASLIDVHLFHPMSLGDLRTITSRLAALSDKGGFQILHRLLQDHPRDANDHYWAHAIAVLIALDEAGLEANWLPAWLGVGQSGVPLSDAIARLIDLCLTYFAASPDRAILLWAASARRQFKILAHTTSQPEVDARAMHALNRYLTDELSFEQIVASPECRLLNEISRRTLVATANFAAGCLEERDRFRPLYAEEQVRAMWSQELRLLASRPDYMAIVRDRDLGDLSTVEHAAIVWDELAHATLCIIAETPRWWTHVLEHHRARVRDLAVQGYWSARKMLAMPDDEETIAPTSEWIADRFFFADRVTAERLARAYGHPTTG